MLGISVHNVNQGLAEGLRQIQAFGELEDSRNGRVLVMPWPVQTTYEDPTARVLFSPLRDANPFFHLMESLWMLSGRNDLAWPRMFVKNFKDYSDDGVTLHGAYGYRWRFKFGMDQLELIIGELKDNPSTRRAVLTMWSPQADLVRESKDIPCNTHAYFDVRHGRVNMTVCCRSNDLWWGCYGANAVHFSILLEYVAGCVGLPVGRYTQLSNNFHLYPDTVSHTLDRRGKMRFDDLLDDACNNDVYTSGDPYTGRRAHRVQPKDFIVPLVAQIQGKRGFDDALDKFLADAAAPHDYPFFRRVASPVYRAWACYKLGSLGEAMEEAMKIEAGDWRRACTEWLDRRIKARVSNVL